MSALKGWLGILVLLLTLAWVAWLIWNSPPDEPPPAQPDSGWPDREHW